MMRKRDRETLWLVVTAILARGFILRYWAGQRDAETDMAAAPCAGHLTVARGAAR